MSDLYKRLGLKTNCTDSEIKKAFRKLAKIHHPDKNGGEESNEWLEILASYNVLSSPSLRASYDRTGEVPEQESVVTEEEQNKKLAEQKVSEQFISILSSWEEDRDCLFHKDPFILIKEKIIAAQDDAKVMKESINDRITNLNLYRTHCLRDNSDIGVFVGTLNNRIDNYIASIKIIDREELMQKIALTLLDDVSFREMLENERLEHEKDIS